MFSVLLVDDEENVLKILLELIQWQEMGIGQLYTAKDGQCALSIMNRYKINVLITDIEMPRLDGFGLIERVKELYPETKCILLTAYAEFEYAKKAISLGVENYLLKPVLKEEFEQTVKKTLDNLHGNIPGTERQLRENILRRWIIGSISGEELEARAEILELNLYLRQYCVICIQKKTTQDIWRLLEVCESYLAAQMEAYSLWDEKGRFVIIIAGKEMDLEEISQELELLIVNEGAEKKVRIALGYIVQDVSFVHLSYQSACDNIEVLGDFPSCIIRKRDDLSISWNTDFIIEEIRFLLFCDNEKIRSNHYKRIGSKLYYGTKSSDMLKLLMQLCGICMKILTTEFPLCMEFEKQSLDVQKANQTEFSKNEFLEEVENILIHTQQIFDHNFAQFSPIVQKACKYVWECVLGGRSCSIKEFCAQNNMNAAYLGHIYRLETGNFFNDYLMQCRIGRSIVLLQNPNNRINEISEMIGFSSVSYFVKRFRECKGKSPDKYREGLDINHLNDRLKILKDF